MTLGTLGRAILLAAVVCSVTATTAGAAVPVRSFQGTVGARLFGPSRIATAASGRFFVVDARGRVNMLTRRGDFVATVLDGAWAVTAGKGKVYAASSAAELVTLDDKYGRVLARVGLGVGEGPVGLSYDSVRDLVWMVFKSGAVQARRTDGTVAIQFSAAASGPLFQLADVAVDAQAGVVWVAREKESPGGMIFGLNANDGTRVKVIGASGVGPAKVTGALALGPDGSLHVTDLFAGKVQVVDSAGATLQTVTVSTSAAGLAAQPAGLAFMANGDLLVADLFGSQLDRFGDGAPLPSCVGDADCDDMSDAWEAAHGLAASNPGDSLLDLDGDGLLNGEEFALGTDPSKADTDGDGVPDGAEVANGTDPLTPPNTRPVVVASGATDFAPGIVTLSATVTEIANSTACTAAWRQLQGSAATLRGAAGFSPSFVARKAETFRFSVVATCAGVASDPAEVIATVVNVAPLADVARVAVVEEGASLELSARRSSDANADRLSFAWEQSTGVAISGGGAASALSLHDVAEGSYGFKVTVVDASGASAEAATSVVALGRKHVPVAAAVSPLTGVVGRSIALDASASHRLGGATFDWRQVAGAPVTVANAGQPVASFLPPEAGRYVFEVTVARKGITSPPAQVEVFVAGAGQALPVASAVAPSIAAVGSAVTLDGTGSSSAAGGNLEYFWRQTAGPAAGLGAADRPLAAAYLFAPGSYEFELTVKDGAGIGLPRRLRLEARQGGKAIPLARVAAPATAVVGQTVVLDGRASTGAANFRWTQVAGPWAAVGTGAMATFKPKAGGAYVFELEVDDGQVRSAPFRVNVAVTGAETEN